MTTVQEIHNEFYSAEERLLKEVESIINTPKEVSANIVERLNKIGFHQSKPAKDAQLFQAKQNDAKVTRDAITYYRQYYPANKFITQKEVSRICEKYGLVLGEAANYTGDIPEKNILEIEGFKIRDEDMIPANHIEYIDSRTVGFFYTDPSQYRRDLWDRRRDESDWFSNFGMVIPSGLRSSSSRSQSRERSIFEVEMERQRQNDPRGIAAMQQVSHHSALPANKPAFKICAPKRDFNTLGYVEIDRVLVYDPVVLQPVKDGFLIVTAWGEEASDELVINQKMN